MLEATLRGLSAAAPTEATGVLLGTEAADCEAKAVWTVFAGGCAACSFALSRAFASSLLGSTRRPEDAWLAAAELVRW